MLRNKSLKKYTFGATKKKKIFYLYLPECTKRKQSTKNSRDFLLFGGIFLWLYMNIHPFEHLYFFSCHRDGIEERNCFRAL